MGYQIGQCAPPNFIPCGDTVGMTTSTESSRLLLPVSQLKSRDFSTLIRVFVDGDETTYIEFGDETVEARAWSGPPPLTCSYVIPARETVILPLPDGATHVAAILYRNTGGIYFTPGVGVWVGPQPKL